MILDIEVDGSKVFASKGMEKPSSARREHEINYGRVKYGLTMVDLAVLLEPSWRSRT